MHVLGHGFSHRRKSSHRRPRDLHIRKVSFSGSSHSGCSASSTSTASTPTARTPVGGNPPASPSIDPLHMHSAFHAPPRLHDRPFIHADLPAPAIVDEDDAVYASDEDAADLCTPQQPVSMSLPPHASPYDNDDQERQEPRDYFFTTLSSRPPLPRSHWSESTIQTIDMSSADASSSEDDDEEDEMAGLAEPDETDDDDDASVLEMRRLSRHLTRRPSAALQAIAVNIAYNPRPVAVGASAPKRPPMRSLDSVDNFIRRGGWKRRGIIFRPEDMENNQQPRAERASY